MSKLTDFFFDIEEAQKQAKRFINHQDFKSYVWYEYERTLAEKLSDKDDPLSELELIRFSMRVYIDDILDVLAAYEQYELCNELKEHHRKLYHECFQMQMKLETLQSQPTPPPIPTPMPTPLPTPLPENFDK